MICLDRFNRHYISHRRSRFVNYGPVRVCRHSELLLVLYMHRVNVPGTSYFVDSFFIPTTASTWTNNQYTPSRHTFSSGEPNTQKEHVPCRVFSYIPRQFIFKHVIIISLLTRVKNTCIHNETWPNRPNNKFRTKLCKISSGASEADANSNVSLRVSQKRTITLKKNYKGKQWTQPRLLLLISETISFIALSIFGIKYTLRCGETRLHTGCGQN